MRHHTEVSMRTLAAVTACASVLALSSWSQAAQISSPTIFGSGTQDRADCVVLNGGTTTLAVTVTLLSEYGVTVGTSTCGEPLGAHQFCALSRPIDPAGAFACIVTASSVTNLRAALVIEEEVFDPIFGFTVLRAIRSAPLR